MTADNAPGRASDEVRTERGNRIESAAILMIAAGVLIVARILQPSSAGFGTHEQLLFIPCGFRWLTGVPCPMCGMTTAFALMARGELLAALSRHVLGPLLYMATWAMAGAAGVGLVRGRRPLPRWLGGATGARVVIAVIGVGWLANIAIHVAGG